MLEAFSAQPPFGGSNFLTNVLLNTPFLAQDGTVNPNPFGGISNPPRGSSVDFSIYRPIQLFGNFPDTLRNQYGIHYHLTLQRALTPNTLLQIGYVGAQGHRLLATVDENYGNPQACLDINQIPGLSCGPFGADNAYYIPANAIPAGVTLHLPYGSVQSVTGPNPTPITLVGLRRYSSPLCEPTTGDGCAPDGIPVFGSIFGSNPVASSSYNSFQALLNKRISHGLQFLVAYTWSKSFDNASSVENIVNPIDPRLSRSLSLFDARHRLVSSYYWIIPGIKSSGIGRHLLDGWAISGIASFQSGFPIRITSTSDQELMSSVDYETPGQPNLVSPFRRLDPGTNNGLYFDPSAFQDAALGTIGNAPRTICCGPGILNFDFAIHKSIPLKEARTLEFRTEFFNLLNHTQFLNPMGNITAGPQFGKVGRSRDPRLIQFAAQFSF